MVDESRFHAVIPGEMGNPSISRGADAMKRLELLERLSHKEAG